MKEQKKESFRFAFNATKQMMALSSGIIALTITFSKEYLNTQNPECKYLAITGWILFLLSVFFGQWTIHALTGTLAQKKNDISINSKNIRLPAILQVICFTIGLLLSIIFAISAI